MTILVARVARTRWSSQNVRFRPRSIVMSSLYQSRTFSCHRCMRMAEKEKKTDGDPRINILGRAIEDDFATIRENYGNIPGVCLLSNNADADSYSKISCRPSTRSYGFRRAPDSTEILSISSSSLLAGDHRRNACKWHRGHHRLG